MSKRRSRLHAVQGLYMLSQNNNLAPSEVYAHIAYDWSGKEGEDQALENKTTSLDGFAHNKELLLSIVEGASSQKEGVDAFLFANLASNESIKRLPLLLYCIVRAALFEIEGLKEEDKKRIIVADYVAVAGAFFGKKETALLNGLLSRLISSTKNDRNN